MPNVATDKELKNFDDIKEALDGALEVFKTATEKQDGEIAANKQVSEKTATSVKESATALKELAGEFKEMREKWQKRMDDIEKKGNRPGFDGERPKSFSQSFTESAQYKAMIERGDAHSAVFEHKGGLRERKTVLDLDPGSAGQLAEPQIVPGIFFDPERPVRVRDILPTAPTTQTSIEYYQETTALADAGMQAEGTTKQEGTTVFTKKTSPIKTIAQFLPITRQAMEDIPMLRAHIDQRLISSLKRKEDQQLLNGDGTGDNLLGMLNVGGIGTFTEQVSTGKIDALRQSINVARLKEFIVTAILMHPTDKAAIDLTKGSDDHFISMMPAGTSINNLFAVPIIETTAIAEGTALMGAFNEVVTVWDRLMAAIRISEHERFTKNQIITLAEERLGISVYLPEGLVKTTFL